MHHKQLYRPSRHCFRLGISLVIGLAFLIINSGYSENQSDVNRQTTLLASIQMEPTKPITGDSTGKIQPGTPVKLLVTVSNQGKAPSAAGELYVHYAFAKPLDREVNSLIFQTEKKPLPVIEPGQQTTIEFSTTHTSPALFDFVREDWPLREYQAIAMIDHEEKLLGTLAITFSAYYYPGIRKEFPTYVKSEQQVPVLTH